MPIINSLCDTDLYKFPMTQVAFHQYPAAWAKYKFKCRNGNGFPTGLDKFRFMGILKEEIDHLCTLKFTKDELRFLGSLGFLSVDFIHFLRLFQLNRDYIEINHNRDKDELEIVAEGPIPHVELFETLVLSIVSQLITTNNKDYNPEKAHIIFAQNTNEKIKKILEFNEKHGVDIPFTMAEFGGRRRSSYDDHNYLTMFLKERLPINYVGTSNVHMAMKHGLKAIGTMAHSYLQAFQQLGGRLEDSQKAALDAWAREFRGALGIALTDVVGVDAFLRNFDLYFAKLFDGCRHDSGNPFEWGNKLIDHYKSLRINPMTKTAVFSDGLTIDSALGIYLSFLGKIKTSFGIGTHLTNDCGVKPANIVMKMVECNHRPVAKISDSEGKGMSENEDFLNYLKFVFNIKK